MTYEVLAELVEAHLTMRQIAAKLGCSQTNIRYWLKKHGLKTKFGPVGIPHDPSIPRACVDCPETDPSKFYGNHWNRCKPCDSRVNNARMKGNRAYALSLLGAACAVCAFNEPVALDIHHTDASLKDVAFRTMRGWSRDRIAAELATCILLCKNHHALEHARLRAGVV